MLGKYIALYKYYCKVAPAVWRSRGQQCTGECKHPSLSRGILVVHWGQSIPRAHQRGNGKAWGKRSHQCNAAGTVKLGCTIGRIQQKPGNWIWDICGCSQHLEVQISLRCHKTHVPCCSVLCYSPRRKVRPICIKRIYGKAEKGHSVRLLLFFSTSQGHSSYSHDFRSDFFRRLFQSGFPSHHCTSQPAALSFLQVSVPAPMKHSPAFLQDSSPSPVILTLSFSLPYSFKTGAYF